MKFVLTEDRRATIEVKAKLPNESGGMSEFKMKVTYKILVDERFQEIVGVGRLSEGTVAERMAALARNVDAELLKETVVDWKAPELVDENGDAVPFSDEALDRICRFVVPLRTAMAAGYVSAHNGEGARKN